MLMGRRHGCSTSASLAVIFRGHFLTLETFGVKSTSFPPRLCLCHKLWLVCAGFAFQRVLIGEGSLFRVKGTLTTACALRAVYTTGLGPATQWQGGCYLA
jgi:hypothetical protein